MGIRKQTIEDVQVSGKRVLVRCDFNVPLDGMCRITDDTRILMALPTIRYLLDRGARVILCSHLGRPNGQFDQQYSLAPVAKRLGELLHLPIPLAYDVVGEDARRLADALQNGEAMLLENVRFHAEEEKNDPAFAEQLASLAEVYVNDAFGTAHRAHASTVGVAKHLPAVAGYLMERELSIFERLLNNPKRPFTAIVGGKKVADKIGMLRSLIEKVDTLIITGAMCYTFCAAAGGKTGDSPTEKNKFDLANELIRLAKEKGVNLLFSVDCVAVSANAGGQKVFPICDIPEGWSGMDIGPLSIRFFLGAIKNAQTILWNGPAGVFEIPAFATGTEAIARTLAQSSATTIIGGGDSAAAVKQMGYADRMSHISTGGGAFMKLLEGAGLPGIDALENAPEASGIASLMDRRSNHTENFGL